MNFKWSEVHRDIADALFGLLELKNTENFSINCFNSVLEWGKKLYCKNDPNLQAIFPTSWNECLKLLKDIGMTTKSIIYA